MKNIIAILLLLSGISSFATDRKKIRIVGNDTALINAERIFVAEVHGIAELTDFKYELIYFLHQTYGIRNIVMEASKSKAFFYNLYLQTGDTTIFQLPYVKRMKSRREFWQRLKTLNDAQPEHEKFTVYGIDFERMEFVKAIEYLLTTHPEAHNSQLFNYITSLPDSIYSCDIEDNGLMYRTRLYKKAIHIFEKEEQELKVYLGEDFGIVKDILENPASELSFSQRNKAMYKNLTSISELQSEKYVCILGGRHTDVKSRYSTLSRCIRYNGPDKYTLIEMVCKDCYVTKRYVINQFAPFTGPPDMKDNECVQSKAYKTWFDDSYFSIVNQSEFSTCLPALKMPSYYMFLKNQAKMEEL